MSNNNQISNSLYEIKEQSPTLVLERLVIDKIRYLCNKYSSVEWGGYIIIDKEGDFTDMSNVKFTAIDLCVVDIGTQGFTGNEDEQTQLLHDFIVDNDYMEYYIGKIHSHNNMRTFFSGTDKQDIISCVQTMDYYVSLIVNNMMDTAAKIGSLFVIDRYINNNKMSLSMSDKTYQTVTWDMNVVFNEDFSFDKEKLEKEIESAEEAKKLLNKRKQKTKSQYQVLPFFNYNIKEYSGKHSEEFQSKISFDENDYNQYGTVYDKMLLPDVADEYNSRINAQDIDYISYRFPFLDNVSYSFTLKRIILDVLEDKDLIDDYLSYRSVFDLLHDLEIDELYGDEEEKSVISRKVLTDLKAIKESPSFSPDKEESLWLLKILEVLICEDVFELIAESETCYNYNPSSVSIEEFRKNIENIRKFYFIKEDFVFAIVAYGYIIMDINLIKFLEYEIYNNPNKVDGALIECYSYALEIIRKKIKNKV